VFGGKKGKEKKKVGKQRKAVLSDHSYLEVIEISAKRKLVLPIVTCLFAAATTSAPMRNMTKTATLAAGSTRPALVLVHCGTGRPAKISFAATFSIRGKRCLMPSSGYAKG
jgi:hypothetical protein